MATTDQTLRLLTELGVLGPEDAEAIRQLLAEEPKPADGVGERTELSDRKFGTPIPAKATPILIDAGAGHPGGEGQPAALDLLLIAALRLLRETIQKGEPAKGELARLAEAGTGGDQANAGAIAAPGAAPGNGGKRGAEIPGQFRRLLWEAIAESGGRGEERGGRAPVEGSVIVSTRERGAEMGPEAAGGGAPERPAGPTTVSGEGHSRVDNSPERDRGGVRAFPEPIAAAPVAKPAADPGDHAAEAAFAEQAVETARQCWLAVAELAHRVEALEALTANLRNLQGGQG